MSNSTLIAVNTVIVNLSHMFFRVVKVGGALTGSPEACRYMIFDLLDNWHKKRFEQLAMLDAEHTAWKRQVKNLETSHADAVKKAMAAKAVPPNPLVKPVEPTIENLHRIGEVAAQNARREKLAKTQLYCMWGYMYKIICELVELQPVVADSVNHCNRQSQTADLRFNNFKNAFNRIVDCRQRAGDKKNTKEYNPSLEALYREWAKMGVLPEWDGNSKTLFVPHVRHAAQMMWQHWRRPQVGIKMDQLMLPEYYGPKHRFWLYKDTTWGHEFAMMVMMLSERLGNGDDKHGTRWRAWVAQYIYQPHHDTAEGPRAARMFCDLWLAQGGIRFPERRLGAESQLYDPRDYPTRMYALDTGILPPGAERTPASAFPNAMDRRKFIQIRPGVVTSLPALNVTYEQTQKIVLATTGGMRPNLEVGASVSAGNHMVGPKGVGVVLRRRAEEPKFPNELHGSVWKVPYGREALLQVRQAFASLYWMEMAPTEDQMWDALAYWQRTGATLGIFRPGRDLAARGAFGLLETSPTDYTRSASVSVFCGGALPAVTLYGATELEALKRLTWDMAKGGETRLDAVAGDRRMQFQADHCNREDLANSNVTPEMSPSLQMLAGGYRMDRNAIILIDEAWEKELPGMVLPSMRIIAMKLRNYVEVPQGKDIYLKDVLRDLENLAHKNVNILESNMIYMINPRDDTLSPTAPLVEEIDVSAEKFFSILKTMTETAAGHTGEWAAYAHGREQTVVSNTRHSMVSQIRDYQEVTGLMKSAWMLEGLIYNLYFTVMQWVKQDREIAQLLKLLRKVTIILPGCAVWGSDTCASNVEKRICAKLPLIGMNIYGQILNLAGWLIYFWTECFKEKAVNCPAPIVALKVLRPQVVNPMSFTVGDLLDMFPDHAHDYLVDNSDELQKKTPLNREQVICEEGTIDWNDLGAKSELQKLLITQLAICDDPKKHGLHFVMQNLDFGINNDEQRLPTGGIEGIVAHKTQFDLYEKRVDVCFLPLEERQRKEKQLAPKALVFGPTGAIDGKRVRQMTVEERQVNAQKALAAALQAKQQAITDRAPKKETKRNGDSPESSDEVPSRKKKDKRKSRDTSTSSRQTTSQATKLQDMELELKMLELQQKKQQMQFEEQKRAAEIENMRTIRMCFDAVLNKSIRSSRLQCFHNTQTSFLANALVQHCVKTHTNRTHVFNLRSSFLFFKLHLLLLLLKFQHFQLQLHILQFRRL